MKFDYWFAGHIRLRRGAPTSTRTGAVIAVVGVALALMVMELSLAIVVGFKNEIRAKIMGFEAPISVLPPYDVLRGESAAEFAANDTLATIIKSVIPADAVPVEALQMQAILKTDNDFAAIECVAKGPGHNPAFELANMVDGRHSVSSDSIVISSSLAQSLGIGCDDKVYLYFFVDGEVKVRRAFISGLYQSNFSEYDNAVVYTALSLLRGLDNDSQPLCTAIDIEGVDIDRIDALSADLQNAILDAYRSGKLAELHPVTNIFTTGALYFNWLDLLDTNVVVIFILMACVAAFTLISSLFIIILDSVPTIGILRALGLSRGGVRNIFVIVAMRLVGAGMLIGNVFGIGLALIQKYTHVLPLNPEMYYLTYVPVELNAWTLIAINAAVALAAWLILILPAGLAARVNPAETMRYE